MPVNPTKVRLRKMSINGVDVRLHTNGIKVYETLCKPYITSEITIIDNNNIINNLGIRGMEPVSFSFDGGGKIYEATHYITGIQDSQQGDNLRSMVYRINAAGPSYFYDRSNLVQRSDVNITGSQAIQSIFNEFLSGDAPLNIFQSMGMIAKTEIGGFITANKKPFTAIGDIAKKLTYGNYKSGTTVFFRNADEYVIAPLEHIFNTAGQVESFEQRSTWGSEWQHVFTTTNAIISAATVKEEGSYSGASNLAMASKGSLNVFDISKGMEAVFPKFGQSGTSFGGMGDLGIDNISRFVRGKLGGIQNVLQMDSRRNDPSTEQSLNQVQENMFQAQVKDGINYLVKVPIQSGINVTVGKGINIKLAPPMGDQNRGYNKAGGHVLVADLCHEVYFDQRTVQATTNMRCVKTGINP